MNKLSFSIVLFIASSFLLPTLAFSQGAVTEEQATENRAKPYLEGMAALETFKQSPLCTGDTIDLLRKDIDDLKASVSNFVILGNLPSLAGYEDEARTHHTSLAFSVADETLKAKCLDVADGIYRDLIAFYVGEAYGGIRDRAMLGIEDVRSARAALAQ